jgi:aryl-alcohol dehydrogenase-like predicted oxidoreductase
LDVERLLFDRCAFCTYKNTDLTVSEVDFGIVDDFHRLVGKLYRGEAIALMHKAFDLGITLFNVADTTETD